MTERPQLQLVGGQFAVRFSERAHRQVEALLWSEFEELRAALHELAGAQGWVETGKWPVQPPPAAPNLLVGAYRVSVELDSLGRSLFVTELTPR